MEKLLWVEKYRPKTLDEIVISENLRKKVSFWLENPKLNMPNLIFIGPPGCGKTSLAKLLIKNICKSNADYLILNGSSERGINVVKDSIAEFLRFEPVESDIKIIFIDEADNLTPDAFKALRALIETHQNYTRFIFSGNYDTFPEAILSRFNVVRFENLEESFVLNKLKSILENENIEYSEHELVDFIKTFMPDMRKIIQYAQIVSSGGKFDKSFLEENMEAKDKIVEDIFEIITNIYKGDINQNLDNIDRKYKSVIKSIKSLNLTPASVINILNRIDIKITHGSLELDETDFMNLKMLIGKYSSMAKNSPFGDAALYEFIYKLDIIKNLKHFKVNSKFIKDI